MYEFCLVIFIIGVVEVFKRAGLPNKYSPLASLVLGFFFGILFIESFKEGIIVGMLLGLSATGLYSGSKNLMEMNNKDPE